MTDTDGIVRPVPYGLIDDTFLLFKEVVTVL